MFWVQLRFTLQMTYYKSWKRVHAQNFETELFHHRLSSKHISFTAANIDWLPSHVGGVRIQMFYKWETSTNIGGTSYNVAGSLHRRTCLRSPAWKSCSHFAACTWPLTPSTWVRKYDYAQTFTGCSPMLLAPCTEWPVSEVLPGRVVPTCPHHCSWPLTPSTCVRKYGYAQTFTGWSQYCWLLHRMSDLSQKSCLEELFPLACPHHCG